MCFSDTLCVYERFIFVQKDGHIVVTNYVAFRELS
jgi:hypothetical protein